jgi:hypothetical protein
MHPKRRTTAKQILTDFSIIISLLRFVINFMFQYTSLSPEVKAAALLADSAPEVSAR